MPTAIDAKTTPGQVALIVADLNRSVTYYQQNIGLDLHQHESGAATLGVGGVDLLYLSEQSGAQPVARGHTGLYHFAILVPSRLALARTLRHLIDTRTALGGASDHAVSEALYLTDPDGHGIEIYRDRPRDQWQFPNGTLKMTVDPFDFEGVLKELEGHATKWRGHEEGTTIGHVHLHVAHLAAAEDFYCGILGFELMVRYGGAASFVAAGGYHHHLGLNTWAGVGAPPPAQDAARLNWYTLRLPDEAARAAVVERIRQAGMPLGQEDGAIVTHDPAQNKIHLVVGS